LTELVAVICILCSYIVS